LDIVGTPHRSKACLSVGFHTSPVPSDSGWTFWARGLCPRGFEGLRQKPWLGALEQVTWINNSNSAFANPSLQ